ncbi:MAG: phosphoribosyl-ATP diphosphatase [Pirellulales bacterium]|nr:phosphoribosyl-ATP diphosphatase [Pirellulales bacterium]
MAASAEILPRLMQVIVDRRDHPPAKSYTTTLFAGGVSKIGAKVTEEAAEVVEAAGEPGADGQAHLVREAADLIYHLLVMLAHRDVRLADVEAELARRFGISGIDEKASRGVSGSANSPSQPPPTAEGSTQ